MGKRGRALRELSPAQQQIMECFWEHGELAVKDVRALLTEKRPVARKPVARNTVRTLLERMEEKGWLTHREEGRTYLYSAARSKQTTIGEKISDVVERVCGGSPETLMSALVNFRGLTSGELNRIRRILDDAKTHKKTPPGENSA